jgi:hypothetical protein
MDLDPMHCLRTAVLLEGATDCPNVRRVDFGFSYTPQLRNLIDVAQMS